VKGLSYLALGDSYTIGTGASSEAHNYPSILATRLSEATGVKVALTNPAVNGFTTQDLIDNELRFVNRLKPELVTILIGVNDLVQGRSLESYGKSLAKDLRRGGHAARPAWPGVRDLHPQLVGRAGSRQLWRSRPVAPPHR